MTQQEQDEFGESMEGAVSWMQAVQERLRANDNTQGPRAALEARLRETEKIHESEHEGRVKVDQVLVAAEVLLQNGDEDTKRQTHAKLKELKALWEETSTYIIHCHSRIEWVWLHWSEYLKAREEFELWLAKMRRTLEPELELQLGAREKLWQLDHHRVLLSDVQSQALLLERLLDEAATLHNRTQDPSVDVEAQEGLQEAYSQIRDKAEERVSLLQKIAEEHQLYQSCVQKFHEWLLSKTGELNQCYEMEDTAKNKLRALQDLCESVDSEEKTLQHIQGVAEAVKANTSPGGTEVVTQEVEQLQQAWERLHQGFDQAQEGLHSTLHSQNEYSSRIDKLRSDIAQLRGLVQRMNRELESKDGEKTEEQLVALWRKYMKIRNTLAAEEFHIEQLKAQLKELFRFSQDAKPLSDDVLAIVKEYQSVKGRAFKLSTETEAGLRQVLQDPLRGYNQWSQLVSQILEASAEVSEFCHIAVLVQNIEKLLKHSFQLQERLSRLQVKRDLLGSVFGQEKAESLLTELSAATRNRELLHSQLLQRKSRLQGLISRTKDFGDAYESILKKLILIHERFSAADVLQPDILAKKSQSDQLKVIKKDLEECEAHITALETLVASNPANKMKFDQLYAEWKALYKAVRVKVGESEQSVTEHETFHENLLNMEKWLMIMRQKLESFCSAGGQWSVENRLHEAERALGEFPEKELQLHQTEVQGQRVLARTSEEGRVHILRDLQRLKESWTSLHALSLNIYSLLSGSGASGSKDISVIGKDCYDVYDNDSDSDEVRGIAEEHHGTNRGMLVVEGGDYFRQREWERGAEGYLEGAVRKRSFEVEGGFGVRGEGAGRWDHRSELPPAQNLAGPGEGEYFRGGYGSGWEGELNPDGQSEGCIRAVAFQGGRGQSSKRRYREGSGEGSEEERGESPYRGGLTRRMKSRGEALAEDLQSRQRPAGTSSVDGSFQHRLVGSEDSQCRAEFAARMREFEAWLQGENGVLSKILSQKEIPSAKELKNRQQTLKDLRSRVGWGQSQFQLLLGSRENMGSIGEVEDQGLDELRYRWMLYKSKLKDAGDLKASQRYQVVSTPADEPMRTGKKHSGFLYRVCRVALPLQLLLLALLLLAFFLPMMDEGTSCSLTNNFARSFNIMLRYHGPPPT
ncbi:nesprin-3-like isoform X2 [Megalops cyprinoides]|uniref:nesprin-3-like isoform X2 n=1 Tax=Megalops cyprinoides TaxID=118141 RepID=UPI00186466B1|nr:nesprin-3-like isoform X2 [Megalops cyprinoides]